MASGIAHNWRIGLLKQSTTGIISHPSKGRGRCPLRNHPHPIEALRWLGGGGIRGVQEAAEVTKSLSDSRAAGGHLAAEGAIFIMTQGLFRNRYARLPSFTILARASTSYQCSITGTDPIDDPIETLSRPYRDPIETLSILQCLLFGTTDSIDLFIPYVSKRSSQPLRAC